MAVAAQIAEQFKRTIQSVSGYGRMVYYGDVLLPTLEDWDANWQDENELDGGVPRHRFWKVYWTTRQDIRGPSGENAVPLQRVQRTYSFTLECESSFDEEINTQNDFLDMVDRVTDALDDVVTMTLVDNNNVTVRAISSAPVVEIDNIFQDGESDMHHAIITIDVLTQTSYTPT